MFRTTYKKLAAVASAALLVISGAAWAEDAPEPVLTSILNVETAESEPYDAYWYAFGAGANDGVELEKNATITDDWYGEGWEAPMMACGGADGPPCPPPLPSNFVQVKFLANSESDANAVTIALDIDQEKLALSDFEGIAIKYITTSTSYFSDGTTSHNAVGPVLFRLLDGKSNDSGVEWQASPSDGHGHSITYLKFDEDFDFPSWANCGEIEVREGMTPPEKNDNCRDFDIDDVEKINIVIERADENALVGIAGVWLFKADDGEGDGDTAVDPNEGSLLISDFATNHQSEFGTWWFAMDFEYNGEGEAEVEVEDGVAFVVNGESADEDGRRTTLALQFDADKEPFDASEYAGISFFYKTTGDADITFKVIDTDLENGEDYSFTLEAVDALTEVFIKFEDLELPDWAGREDPFDPENVISIQFVIHGAEGDTFFIDNVWFRPADYTVSIAEIEREVPDVVDVTEVVVVAPIVIPAGEFVAGPSPVSRNGRVNLFYTGQAESGSVTIYDAQGNVVRRLTLSRPDANGIVAVWDLKDARGRTVSDGTYLLRGSIRTARGNERISTMVGVTR